MTSHYRTPVCVIRYGTTLLMKKAKSRKEYFCDDCGRVIRKGSEYFYLNMSPGMYHQLCESYDNENQSIIKMACVECVEKEFYGKKTQSHMENEEGLIRLLKSDSLNLSEARA